MSWILEGKLNEVTPAHIIAASPSIRKELAERLMPRRVGRALDTHMLHVLTLSPSHCTPACTITCPVVRTSYRVNTNPYLTPSRPGGLSLTDLCVTRISLISVYDFPLSRHSHTQNIRGPAMRSSDWNSRHLRIMLNAKFKPEIDQNRVALRLAEQQGRNEPSTIHVNQISIKNV